MDDLAQLKRYPPDLAGLESARRAALAELETAIAGSVPQDHPLHRLPRRTQPEHRGLDYGRLVRKRSRRVIVALAVIVAAVGTGASYAAVTLIFDEPERHLIAIESDQPAHGPDAATGGGGVPGLAPLTPRVDEPGPTPSVSKCLDSWNLHTSGSTRAWLAQYASRRAHVRVETSSTTPYSPASTSYCSVQVDLGSGQELVARALFTSDTFPFWSGSVIPLPSSVQRIIVPRFNSSVIADGSIRPD
jgi:hypothetical protein